MPDDVFTQHGGRQNAATGQRGRGYRMAMVAALIIAAGALAAVGPASGPTTRVTQTSAAARLVGQFREALKANQPATAAGLVAASEKPVRDLDRRIKRLAAGLSAGKWDFSIMDAREAGDVAVVLINDHLKDGRQTIDIKPWYLLRQGDQWRLLAKFTDFELPEYGFDAARVAEYQKLEKWAEEREPQIRKSLPGCGGC